MQRRKRKKNAIVPECASSWMKSGFYNNQIIIAASASASALEQYLRHIDRFLWQTIRDAVNIFLQFICFSYTKLYLNWYHWIIANSAYSPENWFTLSTHGIPLRIFIAYLVLLISIRKKKIIHAIVAFSAHNKLNSKQMNANETLSNFFRHNFFFWNEI